MNNLVHHPKQAFDYARLYASSVAAILVWGFRAKDFDSFFYKDFYDFVDQVSLKPQDIDGVMLTHLSGSVQLNPEPIRQLNSCHGCGFSREPGKGVPTTSEVSWTPRGRKRGKWLKNDVEEATCVTQ